MKKVLQDGQNYVLRFDAGEDVIPELENFCTQESITAATFSGIGSTSAVTLSWYNPMDKVYIDHELQDTLEIISLNGTISMLEGKPIAHAHGSFSDYELVMRAGHVKRLIVAATCEVVLTTFSGELTRAHNPEWNLKLLA